MFNSAFLKNGHRTAPLSAKLLIVLGLMSALGLAGPGRVFAHASFQDAIELKNEDFTYGTYIIDKPGVYRLAEDIRFNPNSPATLTRALSNGDIPPAMAAALELPEPVDAYHAGFPLFTQYVPGGVDDFRPGGPLDARYDPKAFGLGFFAAIMIKARNVVLDLNGYTIAQSREHALLQRFFAVIETAGAPFVSGQGPADFGDDFQAAENVLIKNGTIGRSAHHGIHGNGNANIRIENVDFIDFEVSAVALNGVNGLVVKNCYARNRKDVPVLGIFSSAQFIKHYVNDLARRGTRTRLRVGGVRHTVDDIKNALRSAVNNVHEDLIKLPNVIDGRAQIDRFLHPAEYALFHNPLGVVDGNAYAFLVNAMGVAVNGFPAHPEDPSKNIFFDDVHVDSLGAFINEVVALNQNDKAVIDPVGAVFQIRNVDAETGAPITISSLRDSDAHYVGNAVSNAQAFVAKAFLNGDFTGSHLDLSRMTITGEVLRWVEAVEGYETLDSIVHPNNGYFCNGDSMFHVNKGVIGFKMDAARGVILRNTSANNISNRGGVGTDVCGDYSSGQSHPKATLPGYGGARTRGFSFAGSRHVFLFDSAVSGLTAARGSAIGVDILTDSRHVHVRRMDVGDMVAGTDGPDIPYDGPNEIPRSIGFHMGKAVDHVHLKQICARDLTGAGGESMVEDESGLASVGRVRPAGKPQGSLYHFTNQTSE